MNDSAKPRASPRSQNRPPHGNRRLSTRFIFDLQTGCTPDDSGNSAPHKAVTIGRVHDSLSLNLKKTALKNRNVSHVRPMGENTAADAMASPSEGE